MLINQYLLALGEFVSLDAFVLGPQTFMCFTFFVLATFIVQIVMFNMLIAIMGDTFDKVTEYRDINAIKSKLELISDLYAIIKARDAKENPAKYFFLIEPEKADDEEDGDKWQGSIKTMTRVVEKNINKMTKTIESV